MSFNFNLGSNTRYSIYTDPTSITGQVAYTQNPVMAMAPSIFAMMRNAGTADAAYGLGGLANIGTMNTDLMKPQWMQDMDNPLYRGTQYDFSGLNFDALARQMGLTNPQAQQLPTFGSIAGVDQQPVSQNGVISGSTRVDQASSAAATVNPFAGNYADSTLAQNYAGLSFTGQPQQQTATNTTTQKLNMYGISSTGNAEKDEKALKVADARQQKIEKEAADIAEELFDAMKGAGTKNDKLQTAVAKINKDNVLYVLEAWNTNFADGMDGEDLITAIQGEHHTGWFGHQQEDLENHIAGALFDKADELGLSSEGHAFRAKVNSEHSAWFTSDDTVKAAFDNIIQQVSTKDAQMRQEKAQKAYQNNK